MIASGQIPILIFLFPFLAAISLAFFRKRHSLSLAVTLFSLAGSASCALLGLLAVRGGAVIAYHFGGWTPPFGIEWRLDSLSAFMTVLIAATAFVVVAATGTIQRKTIKTPSVYYMTVLLHVSALLGIILTHDLFNLFVFIEVSSLTAYALIAAGDDSRSKVSSFRYLLVGTVGACFYLLGIGYLYAATGTLNMSDLVERLPQVMESRSVFMGILLILMGLAIKMGLFPFHAWLPDAYTYASDPAASLIAPLVTKTAIYAFIRIFFFVFDFSTMNSSGIPLILQILGGSAVIVGAIMAFVQTDFKRMLAYSSISHIGLIVLGISLKHPVAFMGAILHILNHAVMKAGLFLVATAAYDRHKIRDIYDFAKLRGKMPFTLAAFVITALSMTGIPPLCGFFGKWYILIGAIQSGQTLAAVVIVLSSLLTALYFFKVIEQAFFQKPKESRAAVEEGSFPLVFSICTIAVGVIVLGFYAPKIFRWGMQSLIPGIWG